jgi:TonB-linked SusC/RagA family outer membrane protein
MLLLPKLYAMPRSWLSFLIFFLSMLPASGQTFSFAVDREPLDKVFILIEKQSDYNFIYTREALAKAKPVTFIVRNETLVNVLNRCFNDQPLTYSLNDKHIIVRQENLHKAIAPLPILSGQVLNENGEPVAGVSVTVKSTGLSTATDANGNFSLEAAAGNSVLLISGAEIEPQEMPVSSASNIKVVVRSRINVLDETMVIAYGKTTRRYATGTLAKVKAEEIARQPVSNPLSVLAGRVSGLQITQRSGAPGTSINVMIRGRNSIDNGTQPLYVVDGIPYSSGTHTGEFSGGAGKTLSPLDNINPADIESIEVLKDADVTAIYGSRGANGVILITTKKGKSGKTHGSLNFYSGAGDATRRIEMLKTSEYLAMRREGFKNDNRTPSIGNAPDLLRWDTTRYTDWQEVLIGNTVKVSELTASVSGGTEQTQFLLSSTYRKESTLFGGPFGAQKLSGNANITHQSLDKRFSIGITTLFLKNDNFLPRDDVTSRITLAPNAPKVYNDDGTLNWESSSWENPFAALRQTFQTKTQNLNATIRLRYRIIGNLEAVFSGGLGVLWVDEHFIYPDGSLDPVYGTGNALSAFGKGKTSTLIGEPQLTYPIVSGKHRVDLVAGATFNHNQYSGLFLSGRGYANDEFLNSLSAASLITVQSDLDTRYRYFGGFGRASYNFDNKYLATFTIRRDGSSRYGPANRFKNFGSLGLGWIFTKEKWLSEKSVLSFGKVKASGGYAANDQIGDYRYLDLYSNYDLRYQGQATFAPRQLFNPDFSWEKIRKLEVGLDLGFLKDRILFTANYYHHTTTNQLVEYSLPTTTGVSSILKNLPAVIRNTGLELDLSATIIKRRDFNWSGSVNVTFPTNKLVSFENFENSPYYATYYQIGSPLSIQKVFQSTGVDAATGLYTHTDFNKDGKISAPDDQKVIVNTGQQYFGGMQQVVTYKKFTFSFVAQVVGQKTVGSFLSRFVRPGINGNQPLLVRDRWQQPGDITDVQRFTASNSAASSAYSNHRTSTSMYENGSYLRLKNLSIVYQLLSDAVKRAGISSISIYLQAANLLTVTGYQGLDPETLSSLPPVKMVTAGVRFNF